MFDKKGSRTKDLNNQIESLESERDSLNDRNLRLSNDIETLRHKKKIESEDIQHLMKMKEEALNIQFQKKELEIEKDKALAIAEVKDQYRDKTEQALEKQLEDMHKMYGQILERLPNISMRVKE